MSKRRNVAKAAQKYNEDKKTGEQLSEELLKIQDKYKAKEHDSKDVIDSADAAFQEYKKKYEESIRIVDPEIEPIGMNLLITCALYSIDDVGMFLVKSNFDMRSFKEISETIDVVQTVIAVGPACNQVKVGDKVRIDMESFVRIKNPNSVKGEEVNDFIKTMEYIDGRYYSMLHERQLKYIIKKK